jgi:regulator of replication initiation timing
MYIFGQDSADIKRLKRDLVSLILINNELKDEIDSLKKVDEVQAGFYLRFESNLQMKKESFLNTLMPLFKDGLYSYMIGSFKTQEEASLVSNFIRNFDLNQVKVIYRGGFDLSHSYLGKPKSSMWVEE